MMCAMEKYKKSPPLSMFPVFEETDRSLHPAKKVNYVTLPYGLTSHLTIQKLFLN
jgi:hypothetical protein